MQHAIIFTDSEKQLFAELIIQGMRAATGSGPKGVSFRFSDAGELKGTNQGLGAALQSCFDLAEEIYELCGLTKGDVCLFSEPEIREKLCDPGQFEVDLSWAIEGFFHYLDHLNLEGVRPYLSAGRGEGFVVSDQLRPLFDAFAQCGYAEQHGDVFCWTAKMAPHLTVFARNFRTIDPFGFATDKFIDRMIDTMPADLRMRVEHASKDNVTTGFLQRYMQQHWYNDRWNEVAVLQTTKGFNTDVNTCEIWERSMLTRMAERDVQRPG